MNVNFNLFNNANQNKDEKFSISINKKRSSESLPDMMFESLKNKFKDRNKYKISIICGLAILFLSIARDFPLIFYNIHIISDSNLGSDFEIMNDTILNQIYCFTNLFFPIFAGYITDYLGYHLTLILLYIPTILGCFFSLFYSFSEKKYDSESQNSSNNETDRNAPIELLILSRFLFAVGGESIQIIFQGLIVNYYKHTKKISLGINLMFSIYYFGDGFVQLLSFFLLNKNLGEKEKLDIICPSYIGLGAIILSFILSIFLVLFESYWWKIKAKNIKGSQMFEIQSRTVNSFLNTNSLYPYSCWQSFQKVINVRVISIGIVNGLMIGCFYSIINYNTFPDFSIYKGIHPKIIIMIYIQMQCNIVQCLISFIMGFFLACYVGLYIDRTKNRFALILIGCLLSTLSYCCYAFVISFENGDIFIKRFIIIIGTICLGVGMGFYVGAYFSYIPLICNEKNMFITFGVLCCITHIIKCIFLQIITQFEKKSESEKYFGVSCFIAIIIIIFIEIYEQKYNITSINEDLNLLERDREIYILQNN